MSDPILLKYEFYVKHKPDMCFVPVCAYLFVDMKIGWRAEGVSCIAIPQGG